MNDVAFFKNDNATDPIQLFIEINRIINANNEEDVENENNSDICEAEH